MHLHGFQFLLLVVAASNLGFVGGVPVHRSNLPTESTSPTYDVATSGAPDADGVRLSRRAFWGSPPDIPAGQLGTTPAPINLNQNGLAKSMQQGSQAVKTRLSQSGHQRNALSGDSMTSVISNQLKDTHQLRQEWRNDPSRPRTEGEFKSELIRNMPEGWNRRRIDEQADLSWNRVQSKRKELAKDVPQDQRLLANQLHEKTQYDNMAAAKERVQANKEAYEAADKVSPEEFIEFQRKRNSWRDERELKYQVDMATDTANALKDDPVRLAGMMKEIQNGDKVRAERNAEEKARLEASLEKR